MNIKFRERGLIVVDYLQSLLDLATSALAQNIKFVEAGILGKHHIDMGGGKPFGG